MKKQNQEVEHLDNIEQVQLHTEQVQEILTNPPKWIIRYGISIFFIVIVLIFAGTYFIKYPDMVYGKIVVVDKTKAKIIVPVANSGKIKDGQVLNVKFENYPYMEYGILTLQIVNPVLKYERENSNYYYFYVELPEKIVTNNRKELQYMPQMQGKAEIITNDLRLYEKLISPIKAK